MDRRKYISIFGTVGVSALGLGLAYQLSEGNISLGDESDVSETVSGSPESLAFDAEEGVEIRISVRDTQDAPYSGSFALQDPDGNEVLEGGPRGGSDTTMETHTAEQGGTYRLVVNPQGTRLHVSVWLEDPSE
ncbi:MAG: hypothetical protein ACQETI_08375 [Halobacteriota archaeon]